MITLSRAFVTLFLLNALSLNTRAAEPLVIPVWPDQPAVTDRGEEKLKDLTPGKVDRFISNVWNPTLTVYLPPADKANGAAVVICPGGGYGGVAIDREGHDVARWLNSIGVAGIILKYRMPHLELSAGQEPWPVQDARQALRITRARAAEWKIDSKRVGIMGFSAGGHLASTIGTHLEVASADKASCRPDFMLLVYPVITLKDPIGHGGSRNALLGGKATPALVEQYCSDLRVTPQTPPTFLVHAKDDGVKKENSLQFRDALEKAGVPCRLELYEKGGHGYGLGMNGGEVATWPGRCAQWLQDQKIVPKP